MKEIIIKQMHFVNFKGLRDLTISIPDKVCQIAGDNGLGKSSIFDGFTWVLFGKDRKDRKQFGIKTYDRNNVVIPRIPHEVEIILIVDGQEVKLTRRYNEKWVKQRGSATEEFAGHEEERLYNDVPCSLRDWNTKIAEICSEQVFKFITNPLYFTAQHSEVQREMLFRMAGGISDAEIAAGNVSFTQLLADLTGKTLDEYKREIGAKKKRIKTEIAELPGRIDERRRDQTEPEDWEALETEAQSLREECNQLEAQLTSSSEAQKAINNKAAGILRQINRIKSDINTRLYELNEQATAGYREQLSRRKALIAEHRDLSRQLANLYAQAGAENEAAARCAGNRTIFINEYNQLLQEADSLTEQSETGAPQFNDSDFRCPTCGHPYDIERIEEIQASALANFRAEIAKRLNENARKIEDNKRRGRANNETKEKHIAEAQRLTKEAEELSQRIEAIKAAPLYISEPTQPDPTPLLEDDPKLEALRAELVKQETLYNETTSTTPNNGDYTAIKMRRDEILIKLNQISIRQAKRSTIEVNKARIAQLEEALRNANNELAQLEGIEFTIQEFTKARISAIEGRINALFTIVRFKMFDTQINGAEVETCEATVGGVPFSDLNDADRINAGLDIINAICEFEGIKAPIFIDNAEGVNRPLPTSSQQIRLVVSHDKSIKVSDLYF